MLATKEPHELARVHGKTAAEADSTVERLVDELGRYVRRPVRFSDHARCRAARRNVVPDAVDYVMMHGRLMQRTGVTFYFLGRRDIPGPDRSQSWASRLEGTVVLVAPDGEVITVYRNQQALRTIRRKMKYRIPGSAPDCTGELWSDALEWRTA